MSQISFIQFSVGRGGRNLPEDVGVVQQLLNRVDLPGAPLLIVDRRIGVRTIDRILAFQTKIRISRPDGIVEPNGRTINSLISFGAVDKSVKNKLSMSAPSKWDGDSAQWSQDKKIQSLNPDMRVKVLSVLDGLKNRGFKPKIVYGWRSVAVQQKLFKEGKSKVKFSFHNAQTASGIPDSYAADIIDERYSWSPQAESSGFWKALGEESKKQGLFWGGDWTSFRDWAHVQLVDNSQLSKVKRDSGL